MKEYGFRNTELSIEERIGDLISRLDMEEKAGMLSHDSPEIERLGIPYYNWWGEVLHGHARGGRATVFPQSIGLAATFDENLMFRIGTAVSDETRAKHHAALRRGHRCQFQALTVMSPTLNLFRDPRWGRGQEGYGEDPVLAGKMGAAFIKGLQGNDPRYLKLACFAKHFAVHSGPEEGRYSFDALVSKKDMHETYLYAFQKAVEAGTVGIMGSYNAVNGEPACASRTLLTDILKVQWGFEGAVISDGGGLHWMRAGHGAVENVAEAAAMALANGCDIAFDPTYKEGLAEAVDKCLVPEETVDAALRRALRILFRLGFFDPEEQNPYAQIPESVVGCESHSKLAYEAALKSAVLLKNSNNALPIGENPESIFVCGPNAASVEVLLGSYYGQNSRMTTLLEGITSNLDAGAVLNYARRCPVDGGVLKKKGELMDRGRPYDYCIAGMGISGLYEGEAGGDPEDSPDDGDRMEIGLPGRQLELLKEIRKTSEKLIVVLFAGSPLEIQWVMENADGVLYVFYPGQAGGQAAADILFGKASPSGKTPFSFVGGVNELPDFSDYSMENRTYRYMKKEALIPFGFGLSYTGFEYSALTADVREEKVVVRVSVKNTGDREAEEVAQLYLSYKGVRGAPRHALKKFCRIKLGLGQSRNLVFQLGKKDFELYSKDGGAYLPDARATISVGGSSPCRAAERLGAPKCVSADIDFKPGSLNNLFRRTK